MKNNSKSGLKQNEVWRFIRPAVIFIISVLVVYFLSRFVINSIFNHYFSPVDSNDATPIEVVIPESASASKIANILYNARGEDEEGLITHTAIFKVYVDFLGKANKMQAGTYILSRNMNMKQIIDKICEGNEMSAIVKFTIPEGYTVEDIARTLKKNRLIDSEEEFTEKCKNATQYQSFSFISQIENRDQRGYVLEGYLFPDTYDAYIDSGVDNIIMKFLNRFNEVFNDQFVLRAKELNMTVDEVVTLASLIEKEAQLSDDFAKVSAVFHNRLKSNMPLQSCASLSYILKQKKYTFTDLEMAVDSPYNTYKNTGLPVGPICNPGRAAIFAALYPNETYLNDGYLYFCNGNLKESNELVFSKTYEEHAANVEAYKQYWE